MVSGQLQATAASGYPASGKKRTHVIPSLVDLGAFTTAVHGVVLLLSHVPNVHSRGGEKGRLARGDVDGG